MKITLGILPALLVSALLLHGCAVQGPLPPPTPHPEKTTVPQPRKSAPAVYSPELGAASALYRQAEQSLSEGRYHQAELELERALRIEPRNADYWFAMARIKYQQNLHQQAIQFCLKSKSLAGRNSELIRRNDALIAEAQRHQGN